MRRVVTTFETGRFDVWETALDVIAEYYGFVICERRVHEVPGKIPGNLAVGVWHQDTVRKLPTDYKHQPADLVVEKVNKCAGTYFYLVDVNRKFYREGVTRLR